jgi:hypothetical protein
MELIESHIKPVTLPAHRCAHLPKQCLYVNTYIHACCVVLPGRNSSHIFATIMSFIATVVHQEPHALFGWVPNQVPSGSQAAMG